MSEREEDDKIMGIGDHYESKFDNYTDYVIAKYREERTKKLKFTKEEIDEEINKIAKEPIRSYYSNEKFLKMVKYHVFFNKYKKIYVPTNLEIERLIVIILIT
jgi:hypothetical protein